MVRATRKTKKVTVESDNEGSDIDETPIEDADEADASVANKLKSTEPTTKMFLVTNDLDKVGWENVAAVSLSHPRTGNPAMYFIDRKDVADEDVNKRGHFLFEVLTLDQPTRSWFVGSDVVSDGNWRMVTYMDPLFLILPIMSKSTQAKPLSDHLCDSLPHHVVDIICKRLKDDQLCQVAKKKECDDIVAYAYSEELALSWLVKKVNKTIEFLKAKDITRSETSVSSNFVQSTDAVTKKDDEEYTRYACDIVGDYLESSFKKKLSTKLGLPAEADRKRKTDGVEGESEQNGRKKKLKPETDNAPVQPLEDYSSANSNLNSTPNAPKGAKAKSLHKAAQGSHSLFKFFSPK